MNEVQKILLKRAKKVRLSYHDFINNPFDDANAHKLRVNCRKLRGIIGILKKALYKDDYIRLNVELKNIALIISDLREIDVLSELANETVKDKPDLSDHYQEMFFYLKEKRDEEMKTALEKMKEAKLESKFDKIESKIVSLKFKEKYRDNEDLTQFLNKRLSKRYQKLMDDYETVEKKDYSQIHEIRKDAKTLRFGARYLGRLTELNYKLISKEANKIQDELGKNTDRHVNMQLLNAFAHETDNQDLKKLFLAIRDIEKQK